MMYDIVQQNFMGVVTIIILTVFILSNNNFDKETNRLFLASAMCVLLFIVEEAWEGQLARRTEYTHLRVLLSAIGYSLRPMTAYFLVMIIYRKRKWRILLSIPAAVNIAVAFSALFCRAAYWYTPDNKFVRGPLGFTPFIAAAFYVFLLLFISVARDKKESRMESIIVVSIAVLVVVSTVMESVFKFKSIQGAASGIAITFYYLFLHTNQNNRDLMTGALVRRRFYLDAEKYRTTLTAVISIDINGLKQLNDEYGHLAGDQALITMTEVVKSCMKRNSALYRTGGDEFMMLCYKMEEKEVQELIYRIREAMEETQYRCAIGYAMYHYLSGLEHVCHIADQNMYKNKLEMKTNSGEK